LKLFSLRPLAELDEVLAEHDKDRAKRIGQRALAQAMTSWVHGDAAIAPVEAAAQVMFGGSLDGVSEDVLRQLAGTMPTHELARAELDAGIGVIDLFAKTLCESKGKARTLITQGGAYINNKKVGGIDDKVTTANLATATMMVLRAGKKDYCLVRVP
jgi:tyrosyl-tRNA synthetase